MAEPMVTIDCEQSFNCVKEIETCLTELKNNDREMQAKFIEAITILRIEMCAIRNKTSKQFSQNKVEKFNKIRHNFNVPPLLKSNKILQVKERNLHFLETARAQAIEISKIGKEIEGKLQQQKRYSNIQN